jgi:membrane-associated phospholipid phosphatase
MYCLAPLARSWALGVLCLGALLASGQDQPPAPQAPDTPAPQQVSSPRTCGLRAPDQCLIILGKDQVGIWTSPLRIKKQDLTWLVPVVAATSVAFVFDTQTLEAIGTSDPQRTNAFREVSDVTGIYIPLATIGTSIIVGAARHDGHLEETGWLAGEAMLDATVVSTTFKYASNRDRPNQTDHNGEFWSDETGSYPGGLSFPSGHAMAAWAFAHVVADEYPGWKVKLALYSLAATVSVSRVMGREHFPSDALLGSTMGYLIGGYVYNHHARNSGHSLSFMPLIGGHAAGFVMQVR